MERLKFDTLAVRKMHNGIVQYRKVKLLKMIAVVIDDDAASLNFFADVLKDVDRESLCICFLHPDEAIKVIANELKHRPDYIFINVNTNAVGGSDCLRYLRRIVELNESKIIMFAAVMPHAVVDAFKSMGANDAFQKPSCKGQFRDLMKKMLPA